MPLRSEINLSWIVNFFSYCRGTHVAIIMYDTTRRETLENIERTWIPMFRNSLTAFENAPFVLVGSKIDLESEREVSTQEGGRLAGRYYIRQFHIMLQQQLKYCILSHNLTQVQVQLPFTNQLSCSGLIFNV